MPQTIDADLRSSQSRLRLETLIRLRWLALAGQTSALIFVYFGLGFVFPIGIGLGLVAVSAWLNVFLTLRWASTTRLHEAWAAMLLAFDITQLGCLLYLTGGVNNPFAIFLIAPAVISAATLSRQKTVLLSGLVIVVASVLARFSLPLPWREGESLTLPPLYAFGMWIAIVSSLVFMATYAYRVAEESRQLARAVAATDLVLAREHELHALDGLAAAAAHELGTPLSTIYLTARELSEDFSSDDPRLTDIEVIQTQAARCRDILKTLTSLSSEQDVHFRRMPLSQLIEEVVAPYRDFGPTIEVKIDTGPGEPIGRRNPAIHYGLGNLIENAVDFATQTVRVTARADAKEVEIVIEDDGPGFSSEIMGRLGEPYVSGTRNSNDPDATARRQGLGLGFFIAKMLLARTGAIIELQNAKLPAHGASVRVAWTRAAMEDRDPAMSMSKTSPPPQPDGTA